MKTKKLIQVWREIKTKEEARQVAIDWQNNFTNEEYTYFDLSNASGIFTRLGEKFNLIEEFKENGII